MSNSTTSTIWVRKLILIVFPSIFSEIVREYPFSVSLQKIVTLIYGSLSRNITGTTSSACENRSIEQFSKQTFIFLDKGAGVMDKSNANNDIALSV